MVLNSNTKLIKNAFKTITKIVTFLNVKNRTSTNTTENYKNQLPLKMMLKCANSNRTLILTNTLLKCLDSNLTLTIKVKVLILLIKLLTIKLTLRKTIQDRKKWKMNYTEESLWVD